MTYLRFRPSVFQPLSISRMVTEHPTHAPQWWLIEDRWRKSVCELEGFDTSLLESSAGSQIADDGDIFAELRESANLYAAA